MISELIHLSLLFLIIMDPLGNVPIFIGVLRHLDHKRQRVVIIREMLIALAIMVLFLFFGSGFFKLLSVDQNSMEITGGVILLLIGVPMIFSHPQSEELKQSERGEPLIVPLAVPAIAGPAVLAAITVYGGGVEGSTGIVLIALIIAWLLTLPVLLLAPLLKKWMGENGLTAIEHLFGYLLVLISGQMILHGFVGAFG